MKRRKSVLIASALALSLASPATTLAGKSAGGSSKSSKGDYRSAKTGKYVKKEYADKHKDTTVREERKKQ